MKRFGCDKICRVGQSHYQGEGSLSSCEGPGWSSGEPMSSFSVDFSPQIFLGVGYKLMKYYQTTEAGIQSELAKLSKKEKDRIYDLRGKVSPFFNIWIKG